MCADPSNEKNSILPFLKDEDSVIGTLTVELRPGYQMTFFGEEDSTNTPIVFIKSDTQSISYIPRSYEVELISAELPADCRSQNAAGALWQDAYYQGSHHCIVEDILKLELPWAASSLHVEPGYKVVTFTDINYGDDFGSGAAKVYTDTGNYGELSPAVEIGSYLLVPTLAVRGIETEEQDGKASTVKISYGRSGEEVQSIELNTRGPAGPQGEPGADGEDGETPTIKRSYVDTVSGDRVVVFEIDGREFEIVIPRGPAGADGVSPTIESITTKRDSVVVVIQDAAGKHDIVIPQGPAGPQGPPGETAATSGTTQLTVQINQLQEQTEAQADVLAQIISTDDFQTPWLYYNYEACSLEETGISRYDEETGTFVRCDGELWEPLSETDSSTAALNGSLAVGRAHACIINHNHADTTLDQVECWGNNGLHQTDVPPSVQGVTSQIALGGSHSCALRNDRRVECWGSNAENQSSPPHVIQGKTIQLALRRDSSCALLDDGRAVCWGKNNKNQISIPSKIQGQIRYLTIGGEHGCALKTDGRVRCWGSVSRQGAEEIQGKVIHIAAGHSHTCALQSNREVVCWGRNEYGETQVPDGIQGLTAQLASGNYYNCSLLVNGTVVCWGDVYYGRKTEVPAEIQGNVIEIASHGEFTCALQTNRRVSCWGHQAPDIPNELLEQLESTDFASGQQTGIPQLNAQIKRLETQVAKSEEQINQLETRLRAVSLPSGSTYPNWLYYGDCDTESANIIRYDTDGKLLLRCTGEFWTPLDADGYSFTSVGGSMDAGGPHSCAIYRTETVPPLANVICWGNNGDKQTDVPSDAQGSAVQLALGSDHSCLLKNDRTVQCWGRNNFNQTEVPNGIQGEVIHIVSHLDHTCALKADRTVKCWGRGTSANVPNSVQGKAVQLALGWHHICALKTDRRVECWGGSRGTSVPDEIQGKVVRIAGGTYNTCAIMTDLTAKCWGNTSTPPGGLQGEIVQFAMSTWHTCILKKDRTVWCKEGGTAAPDSLHGKTFDKIQGQTIQLTGGSHHNCALAPDRTVRCWGDSGNNRLKVPEIIQGKVILPTD